MSADGTGVSDKLKGALEWAKTLPLWVWGVVGVVVLAVVLF